MLGEIELHRSGGLGLVDVEAEVSGRSAPSAGDEDWAYAVFPAGWHQIIVIDEPDPVPTGHRAPPPDPGPRQVIGVRPDGTITGFSTRP